MSNILDELFINDIEDKNKKLEERIKVLENKEIIKERAQHEIQEYTFGDDLVVPIRNDGMINATALCKAGNKKINDYLRLNTTKDYIKVIESNTGIPVLELINTKIGGNHSGTWVHRNIAFIFLLFSLLVIESLFFVFQVQLVFFQFQYLLQPTS